MVNRVYTKSHWLAEYSLNGKRWFKTDNVTHSTRHSAEQANIVMSRDKSGVSYRVTRVDLKAVSYRMVI
jgi:hypothetical protein